MTATVLAPSTLVSNTGQTPASGSKGGFGFTHAQAFTTGANSDGYALTSIEAALLRRHANVDMSTFSAELWSDSNGSPNAKLKDLMVPSSIPTATTRHIVSFTAPADTWLTANTTYHFVIYNSTDNHNTRLNLDWTTSTSEDSTGASDWGIADTARWQNAQSPQSSGWTSSNNVRQIQVKGGARQPMYSAGTPGVTVSETTRATEIGGTTTYTVVLDAQPTANVTVTPTSGATATATVSPATLTFTSANWDRPQTVTIRGVAAASTTITHAAVSTDTRYNSITIASVSVTVSASTKTVKFDPTTVSVNEGSNASVTVKLGRAAPTGGVALAFTYDYTGSAATTADTGTTPATLTIASGQQTGTLSIPTTGDSLVEGDETFTVTVTTSTSGWDVVSGQNTATVTITDDDDNNAKIGFGASGQTTKRLFTVAENVNNGTFNVPIVVSHKPGADTTFAVTVETSTATSADYSISTKSVTFTPTGSATQNLVVTITNDALLENNQTIELKISDSTSGTIGALYDRHASGRLARVTITDDERTGAKIAFGTNVDATTLNRVNVEEDVSGGMVNVPITINRIPESSITFAVSLPTVSSNAATESATTSGAFGSQEDFRIVTKSVTFGPTDTLNNGTVSKNLTVTINNDSLVEEDQAIRLWIDDSSGSTNLGRHYARHNSSRETRVTIGDDEQDDATIAFAIIAQPGSRAEFEATEAENHSGGTLEIPVTVSAKPESDITIAVTVVSAGTTATSADYNDRHQVGDVRPQPQR